MLSIGSTVQRHDGPKHTVVEIGKSCEMKNGRIVPVKLDNGQYGIANFYDDSEGYPIYLWIPETLDGATALAHSTQMPSVERDIEPDVILVRGCDEVGMYTIRLHHGKKWQQADELHR